MKEATKEEKTIAEVEWIYTVERQEDRYCMTGITERKVAEKFGLRHLTVIIVPFVVKVKDEKNYGKWIVHDRTAKQWAKGELNSPSPSYNLFGGHCTADISNANFLAKSIGQEISVDFCLEEAKRELEEELLCRGGQKQLEIWKNKVKTNEIQNASPYNAGELIKIGFSTYPGKHNASKQNIELSYVFALPVPEADTPKLIAADNYRLVCEESEKKEAGSPQSKENETGGNIVKEHDIALPIKLIKEEDLLLAWQMNPDVEVCDAITRLWLDENTKLISKLRNEIQSYPYKVNP